MNEHPALWLTRISPQKPFTTGFTLTQVCWDPRGAFIGCTRSDGLFEYKDIHTCTSAYYQIFKTTHQRAININVEWTQFRFLGSDLPGMICFTLDQCTQVMSYTDSLHRD